MCSRWPKSFYGDNYPLHLKKQQIQVVVKVRFYGNILFWPYLMQFLPVSLQNRLKMCAFLRGTENWLQPVHTNLVVCGCVWFFISEKPELQLMVRLCCGSVWSGFNLFPVAWTTPSNTIQSNLFQLSKGVAGLKCMTRGQLVSPAAGC